MNQNFPIPTQTKFSNGLTLLYHHTKEDPISACHLFFYGGAGNEAKRPTGVTTLLWSLLLQGSKKRSARQLAEDLESIGAHIGGSASHDHSNLSCYAVSDYFYQAIDIFAEVLLQPSYPDTELEKEKLALLASIRSKKDSIFTTTYEALLPHLYGDHAYAIPASGTESTVSRLKIKDILDRHHQQVVPTNSVMAISTNLSYDNVIKKVSKLFGPKVWKDESRSGPKITPSPFYPKEPKRLKHPSKFEQAFLLKAFPSDPVSSDNYISLKLLNSLLGGGMSARLFQSLREKEGLAYDVGSFFPSRRCGSAFHVYMGLQASRMEEAKDRIEKEIEKITKEPVPYQELEETKNYLKGTFILDHQTNSQRAYYHGWWKALGFDPYFDNEYLKEVDRTTAEKIMEVAAQTFKKPSVTVETLPKTPSKGAMPVGHAG